MTVPPPARALPLPLVLVHGGGFDARCWDRLLPHLAAPALAVDLPGRGRRPADLSTVTFSSCAAAVAEDVDAAGFDEVVLVGHSLAGCSMPATVAALGDRVRHLVFVACTVPEDGTTCAATLDAAVPALDRATLVRTMFGTDMDGERLAWCESLMVAEAPARITEPVDLAPLRSGPAPRTGIRPVHDAIVPPAQQDRFARNVGGCRTVDLDAAHMCMITRPAELAAVLDAVAAETP